MSGEHLDHAHVVPPETQPKPLPFGGRPTETLSGLGLAAAVYGFLTASGIPPAWAAGAGILIGCVPAAISGVVDAIYGRR